MAYQEKSDKKRNGSKDALGHTLNNVPDIIQFINSVVRIKCARTVRVEVAWSPNRR